MFPGWRMKIRTAQIALNEGRCDEASALLSRESVRGFLPAKRLSYEVASRLVDRAGHKLAAGDSVAGWHDIQQARQLEGSEDLVGKFREEQARLGLQKTRQLLERGETDLAAQQIAKLENRRLGGDERRRWKLIVHLITQAKQRAHLGDFADACELLTRAQRLLPAASDPLAEEITRRQQQLVEAQEKLRPLVATLHAAVGHEQWSEVLATADAVLELARDYPPAVEAQRKAWQAVGMKVPTKKLASLPSAGPGPASVFATTVPWRKHGASDTMSTQEIPGKRLIAWIDEVGAFLVCLGQEISIGQPTAGSCIDIPVRADLSRRHATIAREGEVYILKPNHSAKVGGQVVLGPTLLRDGALIELGDSLKIRFTKPHSLSATAILKIESGHKTEPATDAVVLMSESCVLGPAQHSHIRCSVWKNEVVLFRRGEQVQFRSQEIVEVDDQPGSTSGVITPNCRLAGEEFALSFEEV